MLQIISKFNQVGFLCLLGTLRESTITYYFTCKASPVGRIVKPNIDGETNIMDGQQDYEGQADYSCYRFVDYLNKILNLAVVVYL